MTSPDPLREALDRYSMHELDGHDECEPNDCEVAAVRLALPAGAYAAAIGHGDIRAALNWWDGYAAALANPPLDVERLTALIREVDGNHDLGAAALAEAILARLENQ